MLVEVNQRREELIECLADVDDDVAACFLEEEPVHGDLLAAAIRRQTVANAFFPVFMGSAYKNVGVQLLLNGVSNYLPDPAQVWQFV